LPEHHQVDLEELQDVVVGEPQPRPGERQHPPEAGPPRAHRPLTASTYAVRSSSPFAATWVAASSGSAAIPSTSVREAKARAGITGAVRTRTATGPSGSSPQVASPSCPQNAWFQDRKSTRLNSSHVKISY